VINFQNLRFPEINVEELKKNILSQEDAERMARETFGSGMGVQVLQEMKVLVPKFALDKTQENFSKLEILKKEFPGFTEICHYVFAPVAKEMAEQEGKSQDFFSCLRVLIQRALDQGSIQDWTGKNLDKVPKRVLGLYGLRVKNKDKEPFFFLPSDWDLDADKEVAVILQDLYNKAHLTWMKENGISPSSQNGTPPSDSPETKKERLRRKLREKGGEGDGDKTTQVKQIRQADEKTVTEEEARNAIAADIAADENAELTIKDKPVEETPAVYTAGDPGKNGLNLEAFRLKE